MTELPAPYRRFTEEFPELSQAYNALGASAHEAGPLDQKTRQLVKLAFAIGIRAEGAVHAHARRALELGITPEEIKHVVLLALTTLGFPTTVAAFTWVNDIVDDAN